ncbi:hypothetical protein UF66_2163 [Staphylococcus cohnii subsp. cohnii]|uniref:Uncharacterized protein n=1 Tax=Staphylococcus cohnii subsp. cohnii TaxID=74704 RepID=A0A0M2P460_STACC|nr:hypothetical protein UF66_2163 [Staphylococcus cohnii subsp. cohnii]
MEIYHNVLFAPLTEVSIFSSVFSPKSYLSMALYNFNVLLL